ncbi:MAG TPA: DegV family protein [Anaerolineales bacterium]|nr:DegV family protein [Anaerolineales bacterium]
MKIGFVSDSTSDIPCSLAEQYGIEIVPALVNIAGQSYTDGVEITREEFYNRLPKLAPPPTTSSPSVGAFEERYEKLFRAGADFVVSIHPPNDLSGIFNAARLAAQEFGQKVKVLDSGQLSLGLGFQVILAAEAAAGGAILDEVLTRVESVRRRVRLAALLDSIEYVRRSGRVSWAVAMLGSMLRLQPLIELRYGIVHRLGQARTRLQGVERLIETVNSWGPLDRLAVLHTNAESAARQLYEDMKSRVSVPPLLVNVTTAIGTHVGPNGLGFVAVPAS